MSDSIREQVQSIIYCASVIYAASYVSQTKREEWDCDAWRCSFTVPGRTPETFEFFTGLGLRAAPTERDKKQARLSLPGLTEKDIQNRTIYGKRYFKALELSRKPAPPHAADVLHSLILDSSASEQGFSDWCADLGYSDDSIKARDTYFACQENTRKLSRVFSAGTLSALRDALQDY